MFEALLAALVMLIEPMNIVALVGGVLLGLFFGVVPGLGELPGWRFSCRLHSISSLRWPS